MKQYVGHVNFDHLLEERTPETYWAAKWSELFDGLGCGDMFVVREYGSVMAKAHYHFFLECGLSRSTVYGKLR